MDSVSLVWNAKTDKGWKRFPIVVGRNGRIKKGSVIIDGKERQFSKGHFELRYYEGRKTTYRNVGTDATEAINERDRMRHLFIAKNAAVGAGVVVHEAETRKTIKREAERFAKAAEERGAMETADVSRAALSEFLEANPRLTYVDEIDAQSCVKFWNQLRRLKQSDRTIYNKHMRLCGFMKFAEINYRAWGLRAPKFEKKLPDIYNSNEIERLIRACKRDYSRVMIELLRKTGLRDQELRHLCWTDISLEDKKLRVRGKPEYGWKIKDYEQRDVPLPSGLVKKLKEWRKKNAKTELVLGTASDRPNTKMLYSLKAIARRAGVANATLHRFRRTYCTSLLRGGLDLRTVQSLMGHGDLASTMRYLTPATAQEVRDKVEAIFR
jgi:integrase